MKSIVELNAELDALKAEARGILSTGESEGRRLNDAETECINELSASIAAKEAEIADAEERNKEFINKTNKNNKMEEKKKFSLLSAIRSVVSGQPLDEVSAAVIEAGKAQMRASGQDCMGSIVIPCGETRSTVSVTGTSGATVPVEVANLLDELRAESVLEKAGATYYTGLTGDLKVPMMTAASVGWATEVASASDAAASVSSVTLTPHRLTAYLDISKQLLVQSNSNVEAQLEANLVRAINEKFENTILGTSAASSGAPAGILYNVNVGRATDWAGVTDLFATVERANGKVTAVVASPEAKAAFRAMEYNNKGQLVYQNGMLEDVPCYSTSNIAHANFVAGDWRYLAVGQWGGIDITVDPYTQAGAGSIRLVINVFMDAKIASEASSLFVYANTETQCAMPKANPTTWAEGATLTVELTCATSGATIYYTNNGDTPTSASTQYNPANKISLSATKTIKAIAVKDGLVDSEIMQHTYTKPA